MKPFHLNLGFAAVLFLVCSSISNTVLAQSRGSAHIDGRITKVEIYQNSNWIDSTDRFKGQVATADFPSLFFKPGPTDGTTYFVVPGGAGSPAGPFDFKSNGLSFGNVDKFDGLSIPPIAPTPILEYPNLATTGELGGDRGQTLIDGDDRFSLDAKSYRGSTGSTLIGDISFNLYGPIYPSGPFDISTFQYNGVGSGNFYYGDQRSGELFYAIRGAFEICTPNTSQSCAQIPVANTLALLGLGLAGVGAARRKRA